MRCNAELIAMSGNNDKQGVLRQWQKHFTQQIHANFGGIGGCIADTTPVDPCEKCPDALCALNQISYYMPQELMNVINELRTVLRTRLGDGKLFQFLYLEALGDPIRFDLRWLNRCKRCDKY